MTQTIELITKYFTDIPHVKKDTKQNLAQRMCYDTDILPNPEKSLLDGIPDGVPNYITEHQ